MDTNERVLAAGDQAVERRTIHHAVYVLLVQLELFRAVKHVAALLLVQLPFVHLRGHHTSTQCQAARNQGACLIQGASVVLWCTRVGSYLGCAAPEKKENRTKSERICYDTTSFELGAMNIGWPR